MPGVVVGIDGSEHARRALLLAVAEAKRREVTLTVVHVAPLPFDLSAPIRAHQPTEQELRSLALELIDETLRAVDVGDLAVERVGLIGHVASQLREAARGAVLLVVGSRGLGGFRGLLVGSVTQQIVAHAPCPVLVVPQSR